MVRFLRRLFRQLKHRIMFLWLALGVWRTIAALSISALGLWADWAPPRLREAVPLPDWSWQTWALLGLATLLVLFLEGAYRLQGKSADEPPLFSVKWRHGLKQSNITNPWEATAIIQILVAGEGTCYARWGRMIYYLSGDRAWEWSDQKEIFSNQRVAPGKIIEIPFSSVEPNDRCIKILSDSFAPSEHHDDLVCFEIVMAIDGDKQTERVHYGIVSGAKRAMAVSLDVKRYVGAGE